MERLARWAPEIVAIVVVLVMKLQLHRWLGGVAAPPWLRRLASGALVFGAAWLVLALVLKSTRLAHQFDSWWLSWVRAGGLGIGMLTIGLFASTLIARRLPRPRPAPFDPRRRALLLAARTAVFTAPVAVAGFGVFIERNRFSLREIDFPVQGLPAGLNGLRILQISDIHLGPFLSEDELASVIDMANETRPHLAVVTGDLISNPGDPLHACLGQLARLKSDAGILGCLGNHEIYARAEEEAVAAGARLGIEFLRGGAVERRFGSARLNIAGVDYQRRGPHYLRNARAMQSDGAVNLLLSHNPDVFGEAARQGWHAVLAGHTHGGQVSVEILDQHVNVARFFTPYVYGLYRQGASAIYVTRGIGTIGLPVRLGAPPEIALLRLCAT